jgi:HD-GYP domain-containing protein (c-di-GMP phosphodiesterase class II)
MVDEDYLDDIAAAFAQVIDSKSPYTSGHSERVTLFTDLIAKQMELTEEQRRWLKRAALLHDIGKLGVSNFILDKPGKLDPDEWEAMKMHAAHSETILSQIAAFSELASIAAAHHERLDGKGYPHGLKGDEIAIETRIITTADIFDALTAERPYRAAMPVTKALAIMTEMLGTQIDADCFAALRAALGSLDTALAA